MRETPVILPSEAQAREWPRYCRKEYWTKMGQNGPNDHFGQNDLIPNRILAFARPKWTKMVHFGQFWPEEVHFGPFRSASRTLVIPDKQDWNPYREIGVAMPLSHSVFQCITNYRCSPSSGPAKWPYWSKGTLQGGSRI